MERKWGIGKYSTPSFLMSLSFWLVVRYLATTFSYCCMKFPIVGKRTIKREGVAEPHPSLAFVLKHSTAASRSTPALISAEIVVDTTYSGFRSVLDLFFTFRKLPRLRSTSTPIHMLVFPTPPLGS